MNGEVIVTFKSILAKEKFLRLNSLQVDTEHFALQDVNKPLSFLTTYDAPFELSDLDIICLQEVHCSSVQECSSWFLSSRFGVVCTPGSVRSSGCAILFRPSLSLSGSWYDTEGHYLQCEFSFRDQSFRVCCLYVPNPNPAGTIFLTIFRQKSTIRFPLCSAVTLSRFSTELWIALLHGSLSLFRSLRSPGLFHGS